jgi:hypothetical protein
MSIRVSRVRDRVRVGDGDRERVRESVRASVPEVPSSYFSVTYNKQLQI